MCEIPDSSTFARILNLFSLLVIMLAVVLACVDTLPGMRNSRNSTQNAALYTATNYSTSNMNYTTSYISSNTTEYFIAKAEQFLLCLVHDRALSSFYRRSRKAQISFKSIKHYRPRCSSSFLRFIDRLKKLQSSPFTSSRYCVFQGSFKC